MYGQRGKMTIMSLIAFVILAYGAFVALKFIASSVEKKQIKKEVFDTLGSTRGGDRESADIQELIQSILEKKKVEIVEVYAEVDRNKSIIHYSFKYRIAIDYLLFKHAEIVEVTDQIENYG